MEKEETKNRFMNRNIKILPSYLALTWDVLFVWTISIMYFTDVKGLSYSQTVALDSILMIVGCVFCLLFGKIFQRVSPLKATQLSNFGFVGYLLLCIFGQNFFTFIVAQFFLAYAYALKSIKDNLILTESLSHLKRDKEYQRIYGKGLSYYYIMDAIGAVAITYVYEWKPEASYWLALVVVAIAMCVSFFIKNPRKYQERNVQINAKVEAPVHKVDKPDGYLKILASAFVVALLVYAFLFRGVISIDSSMFKIYLQDLIDMKVIPMWSFGYIYAGARICVALSSKYQFKYNLKFGVKSILIFNVVMIFSYFGCGALFMLWPTNPISIIAVIILSYMQIALRIPNQIFLNNYMQVCVPKRNLERVYAIRSTIEYLGYALMTFTCSGLLTFFNDHYGKVCVVFMAIFTIPLVISVIVFVRLLCKKYAQKYTIIKDEYTKD